MANYMSMDTLRFLLFDVHDIRKDVLGLSHYEEFDEDAANLLLESTKSWADQDFYPYYREMDEKPVVFQEGKVKSHPILKKILPEAGERGWLGCYFDYEEGGSQVPFSVYNACNHILQAANNHIPGYLGLTAGSAHLIASFGSEELKAQYVDKMLSGLWSGTMCLTEPQAGSSLSDIKTTAYPQAGNYYKIKGQKIFISGGEHEASENFVHLTLARIEGAPAGTKGISLFVIPKFRPSADGSSEPNDVVTAGDFQKMGQRGYSTVHLVFGENDNCHGFLVGEANQGLKYMFQMMNAARIDVGMTAASTASAAYYASLQYAKERPQGRRIESSGRKNPNQEPSLIINHADVRRMLLTQRAIIEGSLSLLIECGKLVDLAHFEDDEQRKKEAHLLLELLTPISKTYPSEKGKDSIDDGLQILGGYGFCMDFPLQQYYRDVRIMSLYEGTTGIQSLDLLGRKVTLENGRAMQILLSNATQDIAAAKSIEEFKPHARVLEKSMESVQNVLNRLMPYALKAEYELFLADATIFMELMSTIVIGHHWLKMGIHAHRALSAENSDFDAVFYRNKIHTMKFYFKYEMPKVISFERILMSEDELTITSDEDELFD
jgi:alkylation response protein AidB-like acyl-CoA dehydrogenase